MAVKEMEYDPEEDENDPEQMEILGSLPIDRVSDDTFRAEGIHENTFVMTCLVTEPVRRPYTPDDSLDPFPKETDSSSSESHPSTFEAPLSQVLTGTEFYERSTGIKLQYLIQASDGRWAMVDPERLLIRRLDPSELERVESVPGA
jgi:hypothetical protein